MPTTPAPPPGYGWRAVGLEDAATLTDLFTAVDAAEGLEEVLGPEGVRRELAFPGLELDRDTLIGLTPDGAARGFAWVWAQSVGDTTRVIAWFEAHPDHLHLEPFLLAWTEARAREHRTAAGASAHVYLRQHVEEHRVRRRRVFEGTGFHHARTFTEMWRDLGPDLPGAPPLPSGVEAVPWSPSLSESARLASNEAFASHWDSLPLGPEEWAQRVCADPQFRPDLSRLALGEGRVLALSLATVDAEHNQRVGTTEVWVERVGTIPGWRRRGVGAALVNAVLQAAAEAGFTRAGLGVDQDSSTRATALYERLGFVATHRSLAYLKDLE